MRPLVSIIIPVYNMEKSIEACVKSILVQDYENFEVILVNDGSKDNSLEVCKRISETDDRVHVVHTENRGSGPARNTGIERATGDYAYFPDADDYLEPNAISLLVDAISTDSCDLVVFGFKNVNNQGKVMLEKRYEFAIFDASDLRNDYSECIGYTSKWGIQGAPWNKFFDLSVIKQNNICYPALRRHQDEGFIARYMCYSKRVKFINDLLYTYYTNDLKKEWQKYPVDYFDAVVGLYQTRLETIESWNATDYHTHDLIKKEYICNVIKSIELLLSPKHNLTKADRLGKIEEYIEKSGIMNLEIPKSLMLYQKTILKIAKKRKFAILDFAIRLKVKVQLLKK